MSTSGQLRRYARLVNGGTPSAEPEYWDGDIAWATPVDLALVDGDYLRETQRTITDAGLAEGSRAVPAGSLILSIRAPIGYVAIAQQRTAFNQGCRGLVPRPGVDSEWLLELLTALRPELVARGTGSTFRELSSESLASVWLTVPDLDEQRGVASELRQHSQRIARGQSLLDAQQALLQERRRALIVDRLGLIGESR